MNEAAKGKGHRAESRRRRWTNERIKPKVPVKVACSVIPAQAEIQISLKILDSGSRFVCPE
jgi:hypothetical protein